MRLLWLILSLAIVSRLSSAQNGRYVWPKKATETYFGQEVICAPPSGYALGNFRQQSSKLYYKFYEEALNYEAGKAQCESDGAHLIAMRTQEEYENLLAFTEKYIGRVWVGLENPSLEDCKDDACAGQLVWVADGSTLTIRDWMKNRFIFDNAATVGAKKNVHCSFWYGLGSLNSQTKVIGDRKEGCGAPYVYICQYKCSGSAPSCPPQRSSFEVHEEVTPAMSDTTAANVLTRQPTCDDAANAQHTQFWLPDATVEQPYFVIDTGCSFTASTLVLRNGVGGVNQDCGTKSFKLYGTSDLNSDWVELVTSSLTDLHEVSCLDQENQTFQFAKRLARYFKFEVLDKQENAEQACLQYFDVY